MKINLTSDFATEDVRRLPASKDDSRSCQLRVAKEGTAFLSDTVGSEGVDGLAFRFETWDQGNGYCGEDAAADDQGPQRP